MFGQDTNQQMPVGSPTAQNPSMLDNVNAQDFVGSTAAPVMPNDPAAAMPTQAPATDQQPMFAPNNQFVQSPASAQPVVQPYTPPTNDMPSPSAPVQPPIVVDEPMDQSSYVAAITDDGATGSNSPVDHDKLADMKRQALEHLEPLADHIEGTAEERFRTTMMMIQANDNHTLIDKALSAAKEIPDDKVRAQAMLDIINEINYFNQLED